MFLCIFLPELSAYRRGFHETKHMFFSIKDDELLEKYKKIWEKVRKSIKREFDNKLVCIVFCLK